MKHLEIGQRVEIVDPKLEQHIPMSCQVEELRRKHIVVNVPFLYGKLYPVESGIELRLQTSGEGKVRYLPVVVTSRLHIDNVVCMVLEPAGKWKSIQRRGYFRMDMLVDGLLASEPGGMREGITIRNLSAGGIRFVALKPLVLGSTVEVLMPIGEEPMMQMAKVVGCDRVEKSFRRHVIRAMFTDITEKERTQITAHLFELQRQKMKKGLA